MFQFLVRDGGPGPARICFCDKVPFTIGRAASSDLRVDADGVWEQHAEVGWNSGTGRLEVRALDQALLLVNGERRASRPMTPGDTLQLGGAVLEVSLAPVRQKNLAPRESMVWAMVILVTVAQVFLAGALK